MNLVILVPTYQRPDSLVWSLESVLRQKFGDAGFKKKIVIANSDPSSKGQVASAVQTAIQNVGSHSFDEISIIEADTTISTGKRLYQQLKENSNEGDIAIIHCDDDIMLPNTLLHRFQAAAASQQSVSIADTLWSCFFIQDKKGIFFAAGIDPYQRGKKFDFVKASPADITGYALPFISIYTYRMDKEFWKVYEQAIIWSDELPLEPHMKYPFVPFYIGLSAYYHNQLSVAKEKVLIRGHIYRLRKLLPPQTVTDYSNGGIISLSGVAVLNNKELLANTDYDQIRKDYRLNALKHFFRAFFRRQGVSLSKLKTVYDMSRAKYGLRDFTPKIVFKNLRHIADTVLFTQNIGKWFKGWGAEVSPAEFWKKWSENN